VTKAVIYHFIRLILSVSEICKAIYSMQSGSIILPRNQFKTINGLLRWGYRHLHFAHLWAHRLPNFFFFLKTETDQLTRFSSKIQTRNPWKFCSLNFRLKHHLVTAEYIQKRRDLGWPGRMMKLPCVSVLSQSGLYSWSHLNSLLM